MARSPAGPKLPEEAIESQLLPCKLAISDPAAGLAQLDHPGVGAENIGEYAGRESGAWWIEGRCAEAP